MIIKRQAHFILGPDLEQLGASDRPLHVQRMREKGFRALSIDVEIRVDDETGKVTPGQVTVELLGTLEEDMKHDELILAVRRESLGAGLNHGFASFADAWVSIQVLRTAGLWLAPRHILERDESMLQIIPYIVLTNRLRDNGVLSYRRSPTGGESRLHGEMSIGIGGHIDASDVVWNDDSTIDLPRTLECAADREVSEEVGNLRACEPQWIGAVYDNDASVGRVHLGIVGILHVDGPLVTKAEHTIADPRVMTLQEVEEHAGEMESWSRMIASAVVTELRK